MYQTRKELAAHFPYFTEKEIRGAIDRLVEMKVIRKGNFNKSKIDQTCWYSFENEEEFLNNVYDMTKGPMESTKGPMQDDKRAKQYQILNTNTENNLPPLPPPKEIEDDRPSTEEEEEICRRLKNRPKSAKPITIMREWRKQVLKDIRFDSKKEDNSEILFETHKKMAYSMDMKKFGDWTVFACPEHVEFTCGSQVNSVEYERSDHSWNLYTEKYWGKQ